ncbi:hypothetical protein JKP88DRAFT_242560 [Tribonema minus]|uniref:Uncharacterized protein n=1 Tax=Tribonema minus TaxID=303371 RepID=A0A835YJR0_9STRA|nr:hypothetical protein JKP88DRAFT_242560 [Tribonema minus]
MHPSNPDVFGELQRWTAERKRRRRANAPRQHDKRTRTATIAYFAKLPADAAMPSPVLQTLASQRTAIAAEFATPYDNHKLIWIDNGGGQVIGATGKLSVIAWQLRNAAAAAAAALRCSTRVANCSDGRPLGRRRAKHGGGGIAAAAGAKHKSLGQKASYRIRWMLRTLLKPLRTAESSPHNGSFPTLRWPATPELTLASRTWHAEI